MTIMERFACLCVLFAICFGTSSALAATDDSSAVNRSLAGDAACTRCHDESEQRPILAVYQTRHGVKGDARTPGCQSCHGASENHLKDKEAKTDVVFGRGKHSALADAQSKVCLDCHTGDNGGKHSFWQGSQHQSHDVACTSCHTVHAKSGDPVLAKASQGEVCFSCHKTERSESLRVATHISKAGKVTCSDCHNSHGSEGPKLMADISVRDTCFSCHAEMRGPFLWEHPVAMDDCMNCHAPHGSTTPGLLKARSPWVCQECHGDHTPHPGTVYSGASLPGGAVANADVTFPNAINPVTGAGIMLNNPASQIAFRACTGCHTQVHGSNHPAGQRLVR